MTGSRDWSKRSPGAREADGESGDQPLVANDESPSSGSADEDALRAELAGALGVAIDDPAVTEQLPFVKIRLDSQDAPPTVAAAEATLPPSHANAEERAKLVEQMLTDGYKNETVTEHELGVTREITEFLPSAGEGLGIGVAIKTTIREFNDGTSQRTVLRSDPVRGTEIMRMSYDGSDLVGSTRTSFKDGAWSTETLRGPEASEEQLTDYYDKIGWSGTGSGGLRDGDRLPPGPGSGPDNAAGITDDVGTRLGRAQDDDESGSSPDEWAPFPGGGSAPSAPPLIPASGRGGSTSSGSGGTTTSRSGDTFSDMESYWWSGGGTTSEEGFGSNAEGKSYSYETRSDGTQRREYSDGSVEYYDADGELMHSRGADEGSEAGSENTSSDTSEDTNPNTGTTDDDGDEGSTEGEGEEEEEEEEGETAVAMPSPDGDSGTSDAFLLVEGLTSSRSAAPPDPLLGDHPPGYWTDKTPGADEPREVRMPTQPADGIDPRAMPSPDDSGTSEIYGFVDAMTPRGDPPDPLLGDHPPGYWTDKTPGADQPRELGKLKEPPGGTNPIAQPTDQLSMSGDTALGSGAAGAGALGVMGPQAPDAEGAPGGVPTTEGGDSGFDREPSSGFGEAPIGGPPAGGSAAGPMGAGGGGGPSSGGMSSGQANSGETASGSRSGGDIPGGGAGDSGAMNAAAAGPPLGAVDSGHPQPQQASTAGTLQGEAAVEAPAQIGDTAPIREAVEGPPPGQLQADPAPPPPDPLGMPSAGTLDRATGSASPEPPPPGPEQPPASTAAVAAAAVESPSTPEQTPPVETTVAPDPLTAQDVAPPLLVADEPEETPPPDEPTDEAG